MKTKINPSNILAYLQGKYRYKIYYGSRLKWKWLNFKWLMRPHIREQIYTRIESMDKDCYLAGQCKLCGCETTALQMANKACDKPCYPKMLSKRSWERLKDGPFSYIYIKQTWWTIKDNKFVKDE